MQHKRLITCCLCLMCTAMHVDAQKISSGKASYYSDRLHGRTMSNGEKYHKDSMTCAHLNYPLGTLLKVKNLLNKKEVIVRVTDRGPHSKRFIIDLSKAAAKELGIIHAGFGPVEITKCSPSIIPFKVEDKINFPELHLEYQELAEYPDPIWKQTKKEIKKKKPDYTPIEEMYSYLTEKNK